RCITGRRQILSESGGCRSRFKQMRINIVPLPRHTDEVYLHLTFIGKGTPAPIDAPKVLVKEGPYRWVRNPMYIAVLSVVIGEAILFRSFLLAGYALLVAVVVHMFVVFVEEPSLRSQFGESYETYLRTVPRWLPRPPLTPHG